MIAHARPDLNSEPGETDNAIGIIPKIIVNVVIKIGRNRDLAASNKES